MTLRRAVAPALAVLATIAVARPASAFCRTTTDENFTPSAAQPCDPSGDPLFWTPQNVGYRLNQAASVQVAFNDALSASEQAFRNWTSAVCPSDIATCSGGDGGNPSIGVSYQGPTTVHAAEFHGDSTDQNVILFWDSGWPHPDADVTLALTTVTFSTTTGEIYDADIEVNSNPAINKLTVGDPSGLDVYDLPSIFQHEMGHFLGLSHTQPANTGATMSARYKMGESFMRTLEPDDVCGICTIYPPGRGSGTERGGCHCALVGGERSGMDLAIVVGVGVTLLGAARRRKRA